MKKIIPVIAIAVLLTANLAIADITELRIISTKYFSGGSVDHYSFGVDLEGTGISGASFVAPSGSSYNLTHDIMNGMWKFESSFASGTALETVFAGGDYAFSFTYDSGVAASATLNYRFQGSGIDQFLTDRGGAAVIQTPQDGDFNVPLDKVFEWNDCSSYGVLWMGLWGSSGDMYDEVEMDTSLRQWAPEGLSPDETFGFWFGAGDGDLNLGNALSYATDGNGFSDDFVYRAIVGSEDEVVFDTAPEPTTLGLLSAGMLMLARYRKRK